MEPFRPDPDAIVEQLHALALFAKRRLLSFSEHTLLKGSHATEDTRLKSFAPSRRFADTAGLVVTQDVRMWDAIHAIKTSPSHGLGPALQNLKSIAGERMSAQSVSQHSTGHCPSPSLQRKRRRRDLMRFLLLPVRLQASALRELNVTPSACLVTRRSCTARSILRALRRRCEACALIRAGRSSISVPARVSLRSRLI